MKTRRSGKILAVLLTAAVAGVFFGRGIRANVAQDVYATLDLFGDAIAIIQNNYVREVDVKDLIYGAIEGMLGKLDAHSGFLHPRDFQEMQVETQGEFGGLGIEISIRNDWLTIVAPIEGTPAEAAGLLAGDRIVAIDGKSTQGITIMEAVEKLRGKIGTRVTISVRRPVPGEDGDVFDAADWSTPFDVPIIRDRIRVRSVRWEVKEDENVLYVRISQFQARTARELRRALEEGDVQGRRGLVLDLRNNPGGLLDQAIEVADVLLSEGLIVYTDGRIPAMRKRWHASRDGSEPEVPVIVLINGGSASASEIVAGALQDLGAAAVIGTRSFGKGSVQTIMRLRDGSGVRVTTALYYTPSGRSIQAEGIKPDLQVTDDSGIERLIRREENLDRHFQVTPNGAEIDGPGDAEELTEEERQAILERLRDRRNDVVLERALAILTGAEPFPEPGTATTNGAAGNNGD